MKTTITINGLPVEFTDEAPEKPGLYWWLSGMELPALVARDVMSLGDDIIDCASSFPANTIGGFWSTPLVPVAEVKKLKGFIENAWREGLSDGLSAGKPLSVKNLWKQSDTKRVVEGVE